MDMRENGALLTLDHLAVCAETLDAGSDYIEEVLGVAPGQGGRHAQMGTHNRLLSLGPEIYLEVIAIDPAAPKPGRARWFDLDRFGGSPKLTNWIAKCDDLEPALKASPPGNMHVMDLVRGDLRWQMAVPESGRVAFNGGFPALISWAGIAHPATRLQDQGCRLEELRIIHPEAVALQGYLDPLIDMATLTIETGPEVRLEAHIHTPSGLRIL